MPCLVAVPEAVLLRVGGHSSSSRAQSLGRCSSNPNASSAIRARSSPGPGQKQRHRRQVDCLQHRLPIVDWFSHFFKFTVCDKEFGRGSKKAIYKNKKQHSEKKKNMFRNIEKVKDAKLKAKLEQVSEMDWDILSKAGFLKWRKLKYFYINHTFI